MRRGKQSLSSLLSHCSDASTTGGRFSKVDLVILDGGVSFVLCDIVTVLYTLARAMYHKGVVIWTSRIAVFAVVIYAVVSISFPEYPSCSIIAADALPWKKYEVQGVGGYKGTGWISRKGDGDDSGHNDGEDSYPGGPNDHALVIYSP